MPGRPAEQDQEEREQGVELQEDEQVVELVVPGAEQVQQVQQVASRRSVLAREADDEVDDGPAEVRHRDQGEAAAPERAVVDAREVPDAVGEHAGRDEEERLARDVQQLERRPDGQPGRHRREDEEGVGRDDARLLHRSHGVNVIEPLPGAPDGLAGASGDSTAVTADRRCAGRARRMRPAIGGAPCPWRRPAAPARRTGRRAAWCARDSAGAPAVREPRSTSSACHHRPGAGVPAVGSVPTPRSTT